MKLLCWFIIYNCCACIVIVQEIISIMFLSNIYEVFISVYSRCILICVGCICMKCACLHVHIQNQCGCAAILVFERATEQCVCECLTHACQQDRLRQHRLPVGGRAEGEAGGREEEVQSQWAGQQTHLPHSAPQDVSPTKSPSLVYCSTTFCQQS